MCMQVYACASVCLCKCMHVCVGVCSPQLVAMQDCLHRSRDIARWVLFMDFDEYLVVKAVPGTLKPLLEAYAESASVSHGMFQYDVDLCSVENPWDPSHGQMAVEHIVMRDPTPFCTLDVPGSDHKLCEGSMGHRKMIYNPRKVRKPRLGPLLPAPRNREEKVEC